MGLPNGSIATAAEVEVTAPVASAEFVKIGSIRFSKQSDMAYASFWSREGAVTSLFTGVFTKNDTWSLSHAHKSHA